MLEKGIKKKETSRRFEGKKSEIGRGHLGRMLDCFN